MRTTDCARSIWRFAFLFARPYREHFGLALSCLAALLVLCGTTPALAISGETPDGQGVYEIPQERCDELTEASGMADEGFAGDVLFTCDADRNGCRLTFDGQDEGLALGFCENKFDLNPYQYEGALEANVVIEATSFGNDIGVLRSGDTGVDILCETFVDGNEGVKVCRKIVEGECSEGDCPQSDPDNDFIPTVGDCDALQDLLTGRVTGDSDPNISFGLWIDVDAAGQPGSEALFVCDGFKWEAHDPADPAESGVVQYQFTKFIIDTPGCIKIGGTCYRYRP